jgi:hypothetical protein
VSLAPTFPPLARGSQHPYMLTGLLHLYRPRLHFVTAPSLPKLSTRPRRSIRSQLALPDGARRRFTSSRSSQRRFTSPSCSSQCLTGGSPPGNVCGDKERTGEGGRRAPTKGTPLCSKTRGQRCCTPPPTRNPWKGVVASCKWEWFQRLLSPPCPVGCSHCVRPVGHTGAARLRCRAGRVGRCCRRPASLLFDNRRRWCWCYLGRHVLLRQFLVVGRCCYLCLSVVATSICYLSILFC